MDKKTEKINLVLGPPNLSGTLVSPNGTVTKLSASDIKLTSSQPWKSPATGGQYPLQWEIQLPQQQGKLQVTTKLNAQEMHGAHAGPSYWEGAVEAAGTLGSKAVKGKGYLEMTGYSGGMAAFFSMGK
jgi:predicted secreted hydrolase